MPEEEIVQILNSMADPIGQASRKMANRLGLWHLCTQCWLTLTDETLGPSVLFQLRSYNKSVSPGKLDASASGHVTLGEDVRDRAVLEVQEELGITVTTADLMFAGRRVDMFEKDGILSRIFADVFFIQWHGDLPKFALDAHEVAGVATIGVEAGLRCFSGAAVEVEGRIIEPSGESRAATFRREDFIPRVDNYYLHVFRAAQALGSGSDRVFI